MAVVGGLQVFDRSFVRRSFGALGSLQGFGLQGVRPRRLGTPPGAPHTRQKIRVAHARAFRTVLLARHPIHFDETVCQKPFQHKISFSYSFPCEPSVHHFVGQIPLGSIHLSCPKTILCLHGPLATVDPRNRSPTRIL